MYACGHKYSIFFGFKTMFCFSGLCNHCCTIAQGKQSQEPQNMPFRQLPDHRPAPELGNPVTADPLPSALRLPSGSGIGGCLDCFSYTNLFRAEEPLTIFFTLQASLAGRLTTARCLQSLVWGFLSAPRKPLTFSPGRIVFLDGISFPVW